MGYFNMITALIMAGGKGTRMKSKKEKPLILIEGKPMIKSVIQALNDTEKIDNIIVATTKYTPKTEEYVKDKGIKIIRTPGEGYISDLRFIISKFNSNEVL
jgi:adenosylcobinamide-phosphate guanylyltransferase